MSHPYYSVTSLTIALLLLVASNLYSQKLNLASDQTPDKIEATELTIPASPIFDLMGLTPSQVTRFADVKDFKVDWSFRSWKLEPNLAIEGKPIWELFYNRKDLSKYQKASSFMRTLSTLDISVGTAQNEEDQRRIGFAVKVNLINGKDPLMERKLFEDIGVKYKSQRQQLENELIRLNQELDTIQNILLKPDLRLQIKSVEDELLSLNRLRQEEIAARVKIIESENWNASRLDLAVGKVYTYNIDSIGTLTSLRLDRNTALGAWVNGGFGIGKKTFVSGLARIHFYEELLSFQLREIDSQEITNDEAIAESMLFTTGLNLRYGNPVYTFFIEAIYERKGFATPFDALQKSYSPPSNEIVIEESVEWNVVDPIIVSAGGDWRINRSVMLNYGIRFIMDQNFKTKSFTPVINISCLMR